jgi:hypothetical protein
MDLRRRVVIGDRAVNGPRHVQPTGVGS